jgi:hypothetical protein
MSGEAGRTSADDLRDRIFAALRRGPAPVDVAGKGAAAAGPYRLARAETIASSGTRLLGPGSRGTCRAARSCGGTNWTFTRRPGVVARARRVAASRRTWERRRSSVAACE